MKRPRGSRTGIAREAVSRERSTTRPQCDNEFKRNNDDEHDDENTGNHARSFFSRRHERISRFTGQPECVPWS